jgi:hypothetical protein
VTQFRRLLATTPQSRNKQLAIPISARPSDKPAPVKRTREVLMSNLNQYNSEHQQNGGKPGGMISANGFAGGVQAIAIAYGEYTKKSFEDTRSFVEKLSSVRSIDKAVEVQTEFARTAYETFVEESQKIAALYGDLAKQTYGDFVSKLPLTNR